MRTVFLGLSALVLISATTPTQLETPLLPTQQQGGVPPLSADEETICRDRIQQVRQANGQPLLKRETANQNETLLIAAVDQRIDGCSVMVMHNDTSDLRPLPKPSDDVRLIPAN